MSLAWSKEDVTLLVCEAQLEDGVPQDRMIYVGAPVEISSILMVRNPFISILLYNAHISHV